MKALEKILLIVLIGFVITLFGVLAIYSVQYNNLLKSPLREGFLVSIKGNITATGDALDLYNSNKKAYFESRPSGIRLLNSAYNPDLLCGNNEIEYADINWTNDTSGFYSINHRFIVPTTVTVTTECHQCSNQLLNIIRDINVYNTNILWNSNECRKELQMFDNSFQESQLVQSQIPNIQADLDSRHYSNDANRRDVQNDITTASNILSNQVSPESNETLKYLYSLNAEWYAIRANTKIELYDAENCLNQTLNIIKYYNDSICYNSDYNVIRLMNNLQSNIQKSLWVTNTNNDPNGLTEKNGLSQKDLDLLKNSINQMYNQRKYELDSANLDCTTLINLANESFAYQKPICDQRKTLIDIFQFSSIILPFAIGLVFGVSIIVWIKKGK